MKLLGSTIEKVIDLTEWFEVEGHKTSAVVKSVSLSHLLMKYVVEEGAEILLKFPGGKIDRVIVK